MRVLHFADLHLGVENYNKDLNPETGFSYCFGDFLSVLDEVVEFALQGDIDLVLFCGDAYKSRNPTQTQQREFARRIARMAARSPVFLLAGNHDLPSARGQANAVEIFDTLAVHNVIVANRLQTHHVETGKGSLQIVALPWARRHLLLGNEEGKALTGEELTRQMEERLTRDLSREIDRLDPGVLAILAGHIFVAGVDPGTEKMLCLGQEPALLKSNLAHPAFRYVALGHIHRRQSSDYDPPLVYAGSLQRLDFSDEEEEKGFYVVEMGSRREPVKVDFHPVKARRFLTVEIDLSPYDSNPTATALRIIASKAVQVRGAIVRVHLRVPEQGVGLVQEREIRQALKEAQFLTVNREVRRENRPARISSLQGLTPLQALQRYLEYKKTPAEKVKKLLEYGEKLIAAEESGV